MRTNLITLALLAMVLTAAQPLGALSRDDIDDHRYCSFCGMDRKAYGYSRALIRYDDGTAVGLCSLHCAVVEMQSHPSRTVAALLIADRDSRTLLEAERAVWVTGGRKRGVMTAHPVWAFLSPDSARAFTTANGGTITPWEDVLASVRQEVSRERR